jgi:hypothetical protein
LKSDAYALLRAVVQVDSPERERGQMAGGLRRDDKFIITVWRNLA